MSIALITAWQLQLDVLMFEAHRKTRWRRVEAQLCDGAQESRRLCRRRQPQPPLSLHESMLPASAVTVCYQTDLKANMTSFLLCRTVLPTDEAELRKRRYCALAGQRHLASIACTTHSCQRLHLGVPSRRRSIQV